MGIGKVHIMGGEWSKRGKQRHRSRATSGWGTALLRVGHYILGGAALLVALCMLAACAWLPVGRAAEEMTTPSPITPRPSKTSRRATATATAAAVADAAQVALARATLRAEAASTPTPPRATPTPLWHAILPLPTLSRGSVLGVMVSTAPRGERFGLATALHTQPTDILAIAPLLEINSSAPTWVCPETTTPTLWDDGWDMRELSWDTLSFNTCGWKKGELVRATLVLPQQRFLMEEVYVGAAAPTSTTPLRLMTGAGGQVTALYRLKPNDAPGTYILRFDGQASHLSHTWRLTKPNAPGVYTDRWPQPTQLWLYGFRPQERVRLCAYGPSALAGWQGYAADATGQLLIRLEGPNEAALRYVVVGEFAGEVHYPGNGIGGNVLVTAR
jgi:hypothetical protein